MRKSNSPAIPQAADAKVKMAIQPIKNRLRPKKPLSQPVIGNTMALETR